MPYGLILPGLYLEVMYLHPCMYRKEKSTELCRTGWRLNASWERGEEVGSMDGKRGWEVGKVQMEWTRRVCGSRVSKGQGKKSRPVEGCDFFGAKSGQPQHFPLGFEPCQVHALAKTYADLADSANAKQEAGLGTSSQPLSCFSWALGRRYPWSDSVPGSSAVS